MGASEQEGSKWVLEEKGMNQEELAYDMKLAEIAKLNIFAPIAGDDEEEYEEEETDND